MELDEQLQYAYSFYNRELFNNQLPRCIVSFINRERVMGCFIAKKYVNDNNEFRHEIAMNTAYFSLRNPIETLSTLVHEMCHVKIHVDGKEGRPGYHNMPWAYLMEAVGLMPSHTGVMGGKKIGYKVTHYIIANGLFERKTSELMQKEAMITWYEKYISINNVKVASEVNMVKEIAREDHAFESPLETILQEKHIELKASKAGKRVVYACECARVWGKQGLDLHCNICGMSMKMQRENNDE